MLNGRLQFFNDQYDLDWLFHTHLRHVPSAPELAAQAHSFLMFGSEDCPVDVLLYASADPLYRDAPLARFVYDTSSGLLQKQEMH